MIIEDKEITEVVFGCPVNYLPNQQINLNGEEESTMIVNKLPNENIFISNSVDMFKTVVTMESGRKILIQQLNEAKTYSMIDLKNYSVSSYGLNYRAYSYRAGQDSENTIIFLNNHQAAVVAKI